MHKKIEPNNLSLTKIIVLIFFGMCLCTCKKEGVVENNLQKSKGVDSVFIWIDWAQQRNNSIDHRKHFLEKALQSADTRKEDSTKLQYLSKIQWTYLGLDDSLNFRKTNRKAIKLAEKLKDSVRLAGRNWDLASFFDKNSAKDSAYYHFSRAQKIFSVLGLKSKAGRLTYDMARIQMEVKDYTGGEINAVKAIELLKPLDENLILYRCYNLLGIIAKDLKEYERSLEYYNTAYRYLEKTNAKSQLDQEIEINIGVTYREMESHEKAVSYFEKVLNHDSLLFKSPINYARTLNNLAKSKYKANPKTNVESLFLQSLKIRDSIGDIAGLAGSRYNLAQYYLEKKDTAKALANVQKANAYAEQSRNNERRLQSLELLTKLDPSNASLYGQNYIALNDSLQQEERQIRNKFARIRFETDEVVAENQLLARQKQLWTGIAASVLLLGLSIFVIIDQRAKNQKLKFQQEQQASNEKIFNLMLSEKQQFAAGKKLEQKRISEELHDGVLGKMLGARMVLTGLNKKANPEAIAERADAIAALKDAEGEVRSISHELSHAAYQEIHNFIRSIQDLLKKAGEAANINYNFNYNEEVDWDGLKGDIKINLYRMVQESLQNAVKHSKCKNIVLDFAAADDHLQILIQDDGVGFDFSKRKKGIGMRNIRSRIKKLKGSWRIDSQPGAGTSVRFSVPIDYFSKEPQIFDELEQVEKM
ncbi:MAG: tetratricopeptide repeat-containing sensor histidine kinase [Aurantibacter sp.]